MEIISKHQLRWGRGSVRTATLMYIERREPNQLHSGFSILAPQGIKQNAMRASCGGHTKVSSALRLFHGLTTCYNVICENFAEVFSPFRHVPRLLIRNYGEIGVCVCDYPSISSPVHHISLVIGIFRHLEQSAYWLGQCLELKLFRFNHLFEHDHSVHSHQRHRQCWFTSPVQRSEIR